MIIYYIYCFRVEKKKLDDDNRPKTPTGKTPVKRKSLIASSKKVKKIKNV